MPDDMQERTFRIDGTAPDKRKKRFDIQQPPKPTGERTKRFKIEGDRIPTHIPGTNREILFARQRNASDCGPCLVLNTLQALSVESGLSSVTDVRQYANGLRVAANEQLRARDPRYGTDNPSLPEDGWFTNGDVDEVLRSQGVIVRSWALSDDEARRRVRVYVDEIAQAGQGLVVYTGNGRHYRGIASERGSLFELDSLKLAVRPVGDESIGAMVNGTTHSNRIEYVSVASRPIAAPTPTQA